MKMEKNVLLKFMKLKPHLTNLVLVAKLLKLTKLPGILSETSLKIVSSSSVARATARTTPKFTEDLDGKQKNSFPALPHTSSTICSDLIAKLWTMTNSARSPETFSKTTMSPLTTERTTLLVFDLDNETKIPIAIPHLSTIAEKLSSKEAFVNVHFTSNENIYIENTFQASALWIVVTLSLSNTTSRLDIIEASILSQLKLTLLSLAPSLRPTISLPSLVSILSLNPFFYLSKPNVIPSIQASRSLSRLFQVPWSIIVLFRPTSQSLNILPTVDSSVVSTTTSPNPLTRIPSISSCQFSSSLSFYSSLLHIHKRNYCAENDFNSMDPCIPPDTSDNTVSSRELSQDHFSADFIKKFPKWHLAFVTYGIDRTSTSLSETAASATMTDPSLNSFSSLTHEPSQQSYSHFIRISRDRDVQLTFDLFDEVKQQTDIVVDVSLYLEMIHLCRRTNDLNRGIHFLMEMEKERIEPSLFIYNILIALCQKLKNYKIGMQLFQKLKQQQQQQQQQQQKKRIQPDIFTYSTLISLCDVTNNFERGIALFKEMKKKGVKLDVITYSNLITMCGKNGRFEEGISLFELMKENGIRPNVYTYTTLIAMCNRGQEYEQAILLFEEMKREAITPSTRTYNQLISVFGKIGSLGLSFDMLEEMESRGVRPDVVTYNSLIKLCKKNGNFTQGLRLLNRMKANGIEPDHITISMTGSER